MREVTVTLVQLENGAVYVSEPGLLRELSDRDIASLFGAEESEPLAPKQKRKYTRRATMTEKAPRVKKSRGGGKPRAASSDDTRRARR